jgi:hypothetical protein
MPEEKTGYSRNPDYESVTTDRQNNTYIASPGEIQSDIDGANSDGGGLVRLVPNNDYDPSQTVDVKPDVDLDFNGARIVPSADRDIVNVHRRARVFRPHIDYTDGVAGSFTSSVFVLDGGLSGRYYPQQYAYIGPGVVDGVQGAGSIVKYTGTSSIFATIVDGLHIGGAGTVVDMDATNTVNGNYSRFFVNNADTAIHQTADGKRSRNWFDVYVQANSGNDELWRLDRGNENLVRGWVWDINQYDNNVWIIGSSADQDGGGNLLHTFNDVTEDDVTDNAGNPSNHIRNPFQNQNRPIAASRSDLSAFYDNTLTAREWSDVVVDGDNSLFRYDDGYWVRVAPTRRPQQITERLSWEYPALSDVPEWSTSAQSGTTATFNVNSFPRRIHVEHDGSNGSGRSRIGAGAGVPITQGSLGTFRMRFLGTTYTYNDGETGDHELNIGITDQGESSNPSNGNGMFYRNFHSGNDRLRSMDGGTATDATFTALDWVNDPFDIDIIHDGTDVWLEVDGVEKARVTDAPTGTMQPFIQAVDAGGSSNSETVEVGRFVVEAVEPA